MHRRGLGGRGAVLKGEAQPLAGDHLRKLRPDDPRAHAEKVRVVAQAGALGGIDMFWESPIRFEFPF